MPRKILPPIAITRTLLGFAPALVALLWSSAAEAAADLIVPPLVHPRPAPEMLIEQSGVCASRQFKIKVRVRPGKLIQVEEFRIDQASWGAPELTSWNNELVGIVLAPVIVFECTPQADLVSIEGMTAPTRDGANYLMITASGGKGRWYGYERSMFAHKVELLASEPTRRAH